MDDRAAWCMFYSSIVGFQFHPSNDDGADVDLEFYARVADNMVKIYRKRKEALWDGSQRERP